MIHKEDITARMSWMQLGLVIFGSIEDIITYMRSKGLLARKVFCSRYLPVDLHDFAQRLNEICMLDSVSSPVKPIGRGFTSIEDLCHRSNKFFVTTCGCLNSVTKKSKTAAD